ncbi:MAG: hypothetical protein H0S80_14785 [Desulfovibrionaceae bacterium]|nr:hypothetical protein [Desulfovibrionaceae bacterium]
MANAPSGGRLGNDERLAAYQTRLRALKERSSLREVMERELLLEFLTLNQSAINEFPMLEAQKSTAIELLCGRQGHPGYEFIHKHIAHFIVLLAHFEKAVKVGETERADTLRVGLLNTESILIKCVQGIVYAMALITDNFEEVVLRYFGQAALTEYTALIERHELDQAFWTAFIEQFVASKVAEAHREILEGEKFDISKERAFLVIRFLFDDILAKLNPTNQKIDKTRIQQCYVSSRTEEDGIRRAKLVQGVLAKRLSSLSGFKLFTAGELLQAARITCIDTIGEEFAKRYARRLAEAAEGGPDHPADPEEARKEQESFKFVLDQLVGLGVGASIAFGVSGDHFYKAMESYTPEHIKSIQPYMRDYSIPTLERILFFLLEHNMIHLLREQGREEGGKIQVRSGRARRVPEAEVDALPNMSKIRKKQLFGKDTTREGTLLFKPKTAQQLGKLMTTLSLESELQQALAAIWKKAVFRVDIMVLINLELVARGTTNLKARLAEILDKYGVAKRTAPDSESPPEASPPGEQPGG